MQIFTVILEFALIFALGAVWWMARRDLLLLVTRQQTPTLREMESVQASIEQLLERLESKTEEAERRIGALLSDARASPSAQQPAASGARDSEPDIQQPRLRSAEPAGKLSEEASGPTSRYAEVYRLMDAGLDIDEIAHRTGLGSGEVRLVINLRPS